MDSLPNVFTFVAYDTEQNLGRFYNSAMELLADDDWAVFIDSDAMFVQDDWGHKIQRVIKQNPDYGFFTCLTNRVGCEWQLADDVDRNDHYIPYHKDQGEKIADAGDAVEDVTDYLPMSGVCMIIQKKVWDQIGGAKDGFYGVDNDLHRKSADRGIKVGLINSLYIYHLYKGGAEFSTLTTHA